MTDAPVSTRVATPEDSRLVAQMLQDFNAEYGEETPPLATLTERLRDLLAGDRFFALVAGVPVVGLATVALRPSPYFLGDVAYLEDLYVEPTMRGQGTGSALIALLLGEAARRGIGMLEVGVDEPDVDALRFYERHGFIHRDPATGERAFHLYRELD